MVGSTGLSWGVPGMSSVFKFDRAVFGSPCTANCRKGDGRAFLRNPRSEEMLAKLADDLHNADKDL